MRWLSGHSSEILAALLEAESRGQASTLIVRRGEITFIASSATTPLRAVGVGDVLDAAQLVCREHVDDSGDPMLVGCYLVCDDDWDPS